MFKPKIKLTSKIPDHAVQKKTKKGKKKPCKFAYLLIMLSFEVMLITHNKQTPSRIATDHSYGKLICNATTVNN